jgi:hypothetical protein
MQEYFIISTAQPNVLWLWLPFLYNAIHTFSCISC